MDVQHNKIAYVTGSSRGIGEALVKTLIKQGFFVVGIARTNQFQHENYRFDSLDLSDISAVKDYSFNESANHVVLVNNAGIVGEIGPVGEISNSTITQLTNVNTLAPQLLCNNFMKAYAEQEGTFHIINISSGAGKKPIESWAPYCASKAAIDLFSETVSNELEWRQKNNWYIHSCAPGVVDTQMQKHIRSTDSENFKHLQNFKDYHANDDLFSPDYVASKLMELIQNPKKFQEVLISVRDY